MDGISKDYDFTLQYHPGKVNVVADALSCKSQGFVSALRCRQWRLFEELQKYNHMMKCQKNIVFLPALVARPIMINQFIESQGYDDALMMCQNRIWANETMDDVTMGQDGGIRYKGKLMVPQDNEGMKQAVMAEGLPIIQNF